MFTHHSGIIEHIEWNNNLSSFLTVDSFGIAKIWIPDNNLMNQWKSMSTIDLGDGDQVKKVFWVSGCRKYAFNVEKMYSGKEILDKFVPCANNAISSICSDKKDGIAVITAGGVFKIVMMQDFTVTNICQKGLGALKINVITADVSLNDNGKIFVAVLTNLTTVELFSVTCKQSDDSFDLTVEVWPCLVPHIGSHDANFSSFEITNLKCTSVNNVDQIIVCSKGLSLSAVQVYEVKKEQVILHSQFPRAPVQNPQFADTCVCLQTFKFEHDIVSMFVTNVRFSNTLKAGNISIGPKLALVDIYGTFSVYSLLTLTQISKSLSLSCLQNDSIRTGIFSPCDHALFTITERGNAYMFLMPQYPTCTDQSKVKNIVNFLHYSLVESCIPFDIFVFLSIQEATVIEQCYKVLIEDFNKFNSVFQNLFFNFLLNIKAMFYHLFKDYCGVVEMYFAMILQNIFFHITSFFQSEKDANFMDMVLKLCMSSKEIEINKIVLLIDSKDINMFLCNDSAYRPLIQWVTDYAVHIVRLILSSNHLGQNWKLCLKYFDQTSILYLRQLLLIFYIMYQKSPNNHQFHPIFVTMTTPTDITTQLFKLISKLQQILLGDNSIDVTMNDLPFSNLPLMYLEMPTHDPSICVLSQLNISPTKQEFDEYVFQLKLKWEDIHQIGFSSPLSVGVAPISTKLRQIFDGINLTPTSLMQGELVKQCSQCNCLSVYVGHSTRTFNNAWKSCWEEHCYCGGLWKKVLWRS